ncbi:hypothetical protein IX91_25560 (plasmid) [Vibrio tubiashii ATCC 19109]|uniref:HNH endonuclease n=2 Tax=Vibrio tubiashii TaxID=29498 RepID=F9T574_9VIBR|nr:hypothetical protein IX91_25560 [Vibrio tubiashii ATCC 19109]EGU55271.1 hypothetical protein VITU9109_21034 [Vibrio tubiashii ATCC 19109]EIF04447.1 hypothetical protein VT1337_08771 [Vibrio tubiashii NCIMB 1337 = ATCC 19106]
MQIEYGYQENWLYYKCKENDLVELYQDYKSQGVFDALLGITDRSYYPPRLSVELVPSSSWFDNVRSRVTPQEWSFLKKNTAKNAKYRCEICKGKGPKWPVECHEIWHYDDVRHIQTLLGLTALCPACHEVKHIGFTSLKGKELEATAHLALVNGWSYKGASDYVSYCFEIWRKRSEKNWEIDISWLEKMGVTPLQNTSSEEPYDAEQLVLPVSLNDQSTFPPTSINDKSSDVIKNKIEIPDVIASTNINKPKNIGFIKRLWNSFKIIPTKKEKP